MANDSIKIHIGAKDTASAVIQGVSARAVALGVTMGNLATKLITGTINAFRGVVDAALDSEKASVRMDSALRSMGEYTPQAAKSMRDLASAIKNETGASGTATKETISQLLMLGVSVEKMDVAARSVEALKAIKRDGAQALNAVARALNGDIGGFTRMSAAVRNATTIEEKYAAANRLITSGYEQQKANLQTVGGAWDAFNGRLKEGRVKIIEAVFAGLRLGNTFNSMQASLGKFLKSDTFTSFTTALKDGASYALDIAKAMTAEGGAKEVASAMGNVILAALKDGADYIGLKIKNAFGSKDGVNPVDFAKSEMVRGAAEKKAFSESSFWDKMGFEGTRKSMAAGEAAVQEWFKKNFDTQGGVRLEKALDDLKKAVRTNVEKVDAKAAAADDGMEEYLAYLEEQRQADDLSQSLKEASLKAQKKITDAEKKKADFEERTLKWEEMIEGFAKDEADAKSKVARNQQRLNELAAKNVSEYISDAAQKRESEKDRARAEKSMRRKLDNLEGKEARGVHMSKRDREMLQDARDQEKLRKAANDQMIKGRNEEIEARKLKDAGEADLKRQRAENEKNIKKIADGIDDTLEVAN